MSREFIPDASFSTTETKEDDGSKSPIPEGTLRLRPEQTTRNTSRVSWTTETIDNEHMNKKKSNLCCIFHPKDDPDCPNRHEEPDPNAWNAYERQPNHLPKPPSNPQ